MAQTDAATVRKQIVVDAPIERAFTVFTDRFGDFKPPEHNMLGAPITETVFEPRVGGGIVDRPRTAASAGGRGSWPSTAGPGGVQLGYQPAVDYRDRPGSDQRGRGAVLRRVADRTRVELEHRHIDRHGPGWEAISGGVDGPEGWPLYLDRYAALVKEGR